MAISQIYTGSIPPISGSTAFGYFDSDLDFQTDSRGVLKNIMYKLGYPIMDVELIPDQVYYAFEDATMTYGGEVNKFNIKDNLLNVKGLSTEQNLTQKNLSTSLNYIVTISDEYGMEAGVGNVDMKRGYITTEENNQIYDLQTLWANENENGNRISINKVYHQRIPAQLRAGAVRGNYMTNPIGYAGGYGMADYLLTPIYDDLLRIQQTEFIDTIRRSQYSFRIQNGKLWLFPIPQDIFNVWFEYTVDAEKNNLFKTYPSGSTSDQISDYSNVPYELIPYGKINSVGKSWIREYTFALCKILLGQIRSKYSSLPSADSDIQLDGDTLRSEGQTMKEELLQQLRDTLDTTSRKAQLEAKQAESESVNQILNKIPLKIYIG